MADERHEDKDRIGPPPDVSGDLGTAPEGAVNVGREGDSIVQDRVASGKPDVPIEKDRGRESDVAIDADELSEKRGE